MIKALTLSCHPVPTIVVTSMTVALAAGAGNSITTCLLVLVAVLSGQLSIGWSNDLLDAGRDAAARRTDKPIASGELPGRVVVVAIVTCLVVTFGTSLLLGWRAGLAQLMVVVSGWSYNLGVKTTVWSWLPFVTAFGALPAVATLALPDSVWPDWWALSAGALVGVSAHLGNVLPDIAEDDVTGVRGLPHRLGETWTAVLGLGCAVAAVLLVAFGPADSATWSSWVGLAAALVVTGLAFGVVRRHANSEAAFYATMLVSAIGVAVLSTSSSFP